MTTTVAGVNTAFSGIYGNTANLPSIFPQFVQSVTLPNQAVKAEPYRRGSIPYNMPSWDEPLDAIKIVFLMGQDASGLPMVYDFLSRWQALVRLGRGSRKNQGPTETDRWFAQEAAKPPTFAFDFHVHLLRGTLNSLGTSVSGAAAVAMASQMEISATYRIVSAWLASFKSSDLDYAAGGGKFVTIEANLYPEAVVLESAGGSSALP